MHSSFILFGNLRETSPDKINLNEQFGGSDTCARCLMPVYEMDKVLNVKKVFKKLIFIYIS